MIRILREEIGSKWRLRLKLFFLGVGRYVYYIALLSL